MLLLLLLVLLLLPSCATAAPTTTVLPLACYHYSYTTTTTNQLTRRSLRYLLHNIIAHFGGAANKNVGDAFLITWKVNKKAPDAKKPNKDDVAERALAAFLKFIAELSRQQEFVCAFSVAATAKLYARLPNYQARIGAGLHCGYAIEGAIGSPLKIDATYIGPSINFTEFLESSTKKYGQPLVVSEAFFDMLPPHVRRYMRPVDRVLKKGGWLLLARGTARRSLSPLSSALASAFPPTSHRHYDRGGVPLHLRLRPHRQLRQGPAREPGEQRHRGRGRVERQRGRRRRRRRRPGETRGFVRRAHEKGVGRAAAAALTPPPPLLAGLGRREGEGRPGIDKF